MNYLVQHSDRVTTAVSFFGFLFVMYIAVQLKPRKEGPPVKHEVAVFLTFVAIVIAETFMVTLAATHL